MLESPRRDHHSINFCSFQAKCSQAFDYRRSKSSFYDAKDLALCGRRL